MGALAGLGAVPQAVPPQVVADSPLAGEGSWVQPDRETLLTRLERVYAAGDRTASPPPKAGIFAEAEAGVAARNIAAEIDGGPSDRFDGTGYCFLEFTGQRGSALEGQFFAQPPEVRLAEPDSGGNVSESGLRDRAAPRLARCRPQLSFALGSLFEGRREVRRPLWRGSAPALSARRGMPAPHQRRTPT